MPRPRKYEKVFKHEVLGSYIEVPQLEAVLHRLEEEDAQNISIEISRDGYGYGDCGCTIIVEYWRLENDEEYDARQAAKKAQRAKLRAIKQEKEDEEREQLRELLSRYPDEVNVNAGFRP